jgi:hypothetical protein
LTRIINKPCSASLGQGPKRFLQPIQSSIFNFCLPDIFGLGVECAIPQKFLHVFALEHAARAHIHASQQTFLGAFHDAGIEVFFEGGIPFALFLVWVHKGLFFGVVHEGDIAASA